ncbi:hypothetical protein F5884DRAFT_796175 [Xylogone sp. PMI_703]|nr:hypothetical protein F5884DRAFT_796175 [Xylogone sp. PMI_703]
MASTTVTMVEPHTNKSTRNALIPIHSTIDDLLKSYAAEAVKNPLVAYPDKGVSDFEEFTAGDLDTFADAAVARYMSVGIHPADPSLDKAPIVAILAPSSFEIVVSIFALNRLGWGILFLSTRLTPPAYARLLEMADCHILITTPNFTATVKAIQAERQVKSLPMLERAHYRAVTAPKFQRMSDPKKEAGKIAWIIHSSGSTGFPKPIFLTNYACLANFCKTLARRAFCTSPLFHSHCLMELFRCIYSKNTFYLGNYAFPVTRQNLIEAMEVAKPMMLCAVPYVLKLLAESEDGIQVMSKTELVLYGGSSCPDDLGDKLTERGITVVANYGATETGQIMTSFRPAGDNEWAWMRLKRPVADHVLMDEISPRIYECVALDGLPSKGPSNSDDPPNSFRTRDLFIRHPDPKKSNYWKYVSRLDDRITLLNGEKVLPIPVEGRIRQSDLVKEAAMIGVGKTVPGLLVFRSENAAKLTPEEYMNRIWPLIESANSAAETFGRIPKELVAVFGPEVDYPRTDKGTFIRAQLYQQYSDTIDELYNNFENGELGTLQLSIPELEEWLLNKFRNEFNITLETAESDIFAAGADSLQTMRIWGMIKKELDLGGRAAELSQNIVFEKGNARSLAKYLYFLRTSEGDEEVDEVSIMEELIKKYSYFKREAAEGCPKPEKDCVLLTGATGNLGSFLLAGLVKMESVNKVVALVRAADEATALSRALNSLSSRGLQLTEHERSKIVALPSDFSRSDLGLSNDDLQVLLSTLTHVIHSAWAVNFNLGVQSFEAQHIQGVYNLLNICLQVRLASPAKFFFCSSVSAASGTPKPASIPEAIITNLNHAQKMGYGRSKLISEHIVNNARKLTGMTATVLRIGQLAGDGATGNWNETEAVPLMIRSAVSIGALPMLDEDVSWLPVDICATTILDLVFTDRDGNGSPFNSTEDAGLVYHVLSPKRFNWTRDLLPALRRTNLPAFEMVETTEWLRRLNQSDPDPVKNPTAKLYDFYAGKYKINNGVPPDGPIQVASDVAEEDTNGLVFETHKTITDCPALGRAPDLIEEGYIGRFVDSWLRRWTS